MGVSMGWCWCQCLCTSIRSYDWQHWSALVAVVYCSTTRMLQYSPIGLSLGEYLEIQIFLYLFYFYTPLHLYFIMECKLHACGAHNCHHMQACTESI